MGAIQALLIRIILIVIVIWQYGISMTVVCSENLNAVHKLMPFSNHLFPTSVVFNIICLFCRNFFNNHCTIKQPRLGIWQFACNEAIICPK